MHRMYRRKRTTPTIRRKHYRRYNKRRFHSGKRNYSSVVTKTLSSGFPTRYLTKLKYVESVIIDPPTAGQLGYYVFRANSIYDPNVTGTGHQPSGRDIFAGVYKNYMVVGSKITARFLSSETTNQVIAIHGIKVSADSSLTNPYASDLIENGNVRYKMMNYKAPTQGYTPLNTTIAKWSGRKWFGWKDWRDNTAQYSSPMSTNPAEQVYYIVFVGDANYAESLNLMPCALTVTIEYIVSFSEQIEQIEN